MIKKLLCIGLLLIVLASFADAVVQPGAMQMDQYLPLLMHKRVGVFANQTSLIGNAHLVDVLLQHHIQVVKIFAPEHGFRGDTDTFIKNSIDPATGIPIVSLYGKKRAPTAEDLKDIDILVFDIQDVGVRFYTYISSLQKFIEAAVNNHKPLIILDRPNPNGFYVDGPVLERQYHSFTGMQPIPVVYGMTMGEYADMLVGEQWLNVFPKSKARNLTLIVIPCRGYTHTSLYVPPIAPSPNLPNIQSIYWYPSIGLMEATAMSVGRGTSMPFQVFGHPLLPNSFIFVPTKIIAGSAPRYYRQICHGWRLSDSPKETLKKISGQLQIKYLMEAYQLFPDKIHFFENFQDIAGNMDLERQIKSGMDEDGIRKSWQPKLAEFKKIRKKYLLYPDFE